MTNTIFIEQNVPIPPIVRSNNLKPRQDKYPWKIMNVGDSFALSVKPNHASTLARQAGKRNGRKFTARKTPTGMRIWRTA